LLLRKVNVAETEFLPWRQSRTTQRHGATTANAWVAIQPQHGPTSRYHLAIVATTLHITPAHGEQLTSCSTIMCMGRSLILGGYTKIFAEENGTCACSSSFLLFFHPVKHAPMEEYSARIQRRPFGKNQHKNKTEKLPPRGIPPFRCFYSGFVGGTELKKRRVFRTEKVTSPTQSNKTPPTYILCVCVLF
jgi:hypothetical protein